jgi:hypothetical protein
VPSRIACRVEVCDVFDVVADGADQGRLP